MLADAFGLPGTRKSPVAEPERAASAGFPGPTRRGGSSSASKPGNREGIEGWARGHRVSSRVHRSRARSPDLIVPSHGTAGIGTQQRLLRTGARSVRPVCVRAEIAKRGIKRPRDQDKKSQDRLACRGVKKVENKEGTEADGIQASRRQEIQTSRMPIGGA